MGVKPALPYHSITVRKTRLFLPDGVSVFKVYFLSLIGRDDPERYDRSLVAGTRRL